jgi:hypothetical protein
LAVPLDGGARKHRGGRAAWCILAAVSHISDFGQYLLRAIIYRAVTDWIFGRTSPGDPYAPGVELACQLAR